MRKTVLIFGISSFVGSNIAEALKKDFRIVGTYHQHPVDIPGVTCIPCDVHRKDHVSRLLNFVKPNFTIYAAGLSSVMECSKRPKDADALNSSGAANVCAVSERHRSKFIYLSSAYVHGGENYLYTEGDTPFPSTAFGNSLSSAEFYIQRSCLDYLILRCGTLYGRGYSEDHLNWFEHLERSLAKGEKFVADDTVRTGFIDIHIVSRVLKEALIANVTNRLIHVSSSDVMTRYEFAREYAQTFKLDQDSVVKGVSEFPLDRKYKKNNGPQELTFRLSVANIEEFLGTQMPSIQQSLNFTKARLAVPSEKNS